MTPWPKKEPPQVMLMNAGLASACALSWRECQLSVESLYVQCCVSLPATLSDVAGICFNSRLVSPLAYQMLTAKSGCAMSIGDLGCQN